MFFLLLVEGAFSSSDDEEMVPTGSTSVSIYMILGSSTGLASEMSSRILFPGASFMIRTFETRGTIPDAEILGSIRTGSGMMSFIACTVPEAT